MSSPVKVAPSILSADFATLGDQIRQADAGGADLIHIDVMDGHFVPNITLGPPVIKSLRALTKIPFDTHLMIENVDSFVDSFVEAGCDMMTVHAEACRHLHRTAQHIREKGAKVGVAINPTTPVGELQHIIDDIDMIVIMSVNPGFSGQRFIQSVLPKISQARALIGSRKVLLEVDGGVGPENVKAVVAAGADVVVGGNAVFRGKATIAENIQAIKRASGA